ncbi:nuclear cap-binding protein subunit 2-like [Ailuropoda melanoleuca]|uniref:Nuclear cap-binding protein subunit 2 n=2 Tax=Ailuropoda melanoleuca TaxID=9646 RepID=G1MK21_AILME|nr:nuclear cap-binding protein subunit 2-like [Ailuropoda melanoleuca]
MDCKQLPSRYPLGTVSSDLRIQQGDSSLELSQYRDQHFDVDDDEQEKSLKESSTLYVGNLSFHTTDKQIHELFGRCGNTKHVFMGVDKIKKKACSFCFVEYYDRLDAEKAMWCLNGTSLDDHIIHTDWDLGFREGRRYSRGQPGGQASNVFCEDSDVGRGGSGKQAQACDRRGIH